MVTVPPIPDAEEVLSALGEWPSFHDAEVIHFSLSRGAKPQDNKSEAQLEIQVRQYQTRNAGTAEFGLVLIKNVLIRFAFTDVQQLEVEDFNHQNVIDSLEFIRESEATDSRIRVELTSIYGFGATWFCSDARVVGVTNLLTK
ncbi:MAG: Imm50 family immunity protein [Limnobacter sp.]|uniref:Imm50 family immunity protein n=1 Tax=Limnobacter sp. TaxID=2003368 RepID=UPI00391CE7DE